MKKRCTHCGASKDHPRHDRTVINFDHDFEAKKEDPPNDDTWWMATAATLSQ